MHNGVMNTAVYANAKQKCGNIVWTTCLHRRVSTVSNLRENEESTGFQCDGNFLVQSRASQGARTTTQTQQTIPVLHMDSNDSLLPAEG